ncbi:S26 family signal peptidase [Halospeciosus flavus]|uniref:S26 family signal peptidase n=1 Tax=Halospeciosus flavus TaxID=3032283 RepID=UPI003609D16E
MSSGDDVPDPRSGPRAAVRWFLRSDDTAVVFVRETVSSALVVAMVGLLLFAVSGLWPPLVAVESGSMNPHLEKGDLVFVMEEDRFPPEAAHADTGVVTYQHGKEVGYRKFHSYGDVVVYEPDGSERATPVIHRARFYVQEGRTGTTRPTRTTSSRTGTTVRNSPTARRRTAGSSRRATRIPSTTRCGVSVGP